MRLKEARSAGGVWDPIASGLNIEHRQRNGSVVLDALSWAVSFSMRKNGWWRVDVRKEIPWSSDVSESGRRTGGGRGVGRRTKENVLGERIGRSEREDLAELDKDVWGERGVPIDRGGCLGDAEGDLG